MSGSLRAILRPQRWTLRSGPQGPAGDAGGAGVTSVNGDEGPDVTLDAADVGADPAGTAAGLVAAVTVSSLGAVPTGQWSATGITGAGTTVSESISLASWQAGGAPRPLVGATVRDVPVWTTSGTPRWVSRGLAVGDVANAVAQAEVSDTPTAGFISRADGSGKLDGWISDATAAVKGLALLGAATGAQAYSALLTAIASLTALSAGLIVKTGSGTVAVRSVTGSNGVAVTNGDGVAGDIAVAGVAATDSAAGVVELATDGEAIADRVVQGNDTRLRVSNMFQLRPTTITGYTWTNMPSAETAWPEGRHVRAQLTLAGATRFRLSTRSTTAASGAKLRIKYSTDGGSTFFDLASSAAAGDVALTTGAIAPTQGSWATIASGALTDVLLDIYGVDGNGTADPVIQFVAIEWGA